MEKNYFKKVAAVFAATAMMTATAAMSVSAAAIPAPAETPDDAAKFNVDIIDMAEAEAGEKVSVEVKICDGTELDLDSIGGAITWDEALVLESCTGGKVIDSYIMARDEKKMLAFNSGGTTVKAGDVLFTMNFTVPADAKDGDKYNITWSDNAKVYTFVNSKNPSEEVPHALMNGSIEVGGAPVVTTTPEPVVTTTEATTTTPAATTTPEVTTTPAATTTEVTTTPAATTTTVTTTAATTTTKATTTSNVGSSPATGSSNNGVAALAATMVAAAGAAVVLKKKKD